MRDVGRILRGVVGEVADYCTGAGFAPADCYLVAPALSIGIAPCLPIACGSQHLNNTVAYDAAEVAGPNLGQTNMIAVSSFCGVNGLVLGHDLLLVEPVLHEIISEFDGMPVCDILSLEKATTSLFGTVEQPRFPFLPGEHIPCAYKTYTLEGAGVVWSALALAIAKDRHRNADVFMEELGGDNGRNGISSDELYRIIEGLLRSVSQVRKNLKVDYERVYVGMKQAPVPAAHQGCALAAAPYFKLASSVVVTGDPVALANLTLKEWEAAIAEARTSL